MNRPGILPASGLLFLTAVLLGAGCARSAGPGGAGERPIHLFENGRWFDGTNFVPGRRFSADGVLRGSIDAPAAKRIDLQGGFVVPAFGEAHNHNLSFPPKVDEIGRYLEAGVFYVLILNNLRAGFAEADDPDTTPLEVLYANGGLTGPGGHVVELHERLVDYGVLPGPKENLDGLVFYVVDTATDLDRQWPGILAGKPDIVKVFLGASEEHARRRGDPAFFGKRGLDPELLPEVVRRAHRDGLRVAVHIETAADFRTAAAAGVDIVAHLPGWRVGEEAGFADTIPERWLLTPEDARTAAARGVIVVTTVLAGETARDPSHPHHEIVRDIHRRNLQTLLAASVRLALGSDYWNGTSLTEAAYLAREPVIQGLEPLGIFDNLALVRLLAVDTPRAILPNRRVGGVMDGDEATFLVLDGDPVASVRNLFRIRMRVVRGDVVEPPPEEAAAQAGG